MEASDPYLGPSVSAYIIITTAAFCGGIVKGLSGFGSAIIMVLFWVVSKVIQLDPGPLSLTVIADSVSTLVGAVPLFIMTRAHAMADWRLVGTLFTCKTAFSPLGAVLLVVLDKRVVELVMAVILIPVIMLTTNVLQEAPRLMRRLSSKILQSVSTRMRGRQPAESDCEQARLIHQQPHDSAAACTHPHPCRQSDGTGGDLAGKAADSCDAPTSTSTPPASMAVAIQPLPQATIEMPVAAAAAATAVTAAAVAAAAVTAAGPTVATVQVQPTSGTPGPDQSLRLGAARNGLRDWKAHERHGAGATPVVASPSIASARSCDGYHENHEQSGQGNALEMPSTEEYPASTGSVGQQGTGEPAEPMHLVEISHTCKHSPPRSCDCCSEGLVQNVLPGQRKAVHFSAQVIDLGGKTGSGAPQPATTDPLSGTHQSLQAQDSTQLAVGHQDIRAAPPTVAAIITNPTYGNGDVTTSIQHQSDPADAECRPLLRIDSLAHSSWRPSPFSRYCLSSFKRTTDPADGTAGIGSDAKADAGSAGVVSWHLNPFSRYYSFKQAGTDADNVDARAKQERSSDSVTAGAAGPMGRARRVWGHIVRYARDKENQRVIGLGTVVGCLSGVMDGMTGMGGPPMMFLFRHLEVQKDVARAIGAVLNVFQFRLIAYMFLGILKVQDAPLLATASVLHVGGTCLGSLVINKHVSQPQFLKLLVVLMVLCCLLLIAAASGLTSA